MKGTVLEEIRVEIVGQISQKDIDDGTVLIFRITDNRFPREAMNRLVDNIRQNVIDTFQGQVKAMIVPSYIEVTTLKDILKDAVKNDE